MDITATGWKNKGGTAVRSCNCGSWAQHWVNFAHETWPVTCSVSRCNNRATLGAHIINPSVIGEKIVPMCASCNGLAGSFSLKGGITLPSANTAETCEARLRP